LIYLYNITVFLIVSTGESVYYTANRENLIYLVRPKFSYISREEEVEVLKSFKERSNNRQSEYNSTSKEDNPVVALPGSPGIGKSTFLSRFPLNSGYITFAGQPLIVSVIIITLLLLL
jgi:hypothetical protein